MKQPEVYEDKPDKVCKLKPSLYGLKQAPRCWRNMRFGSYLIKIRFKTSHSDPWMLIREEKGEKTILALYVDDGLVAATDLNDLKTFLNEIKYEFKIVSKEATYRKHNYKPRGIY